MKIAFLFGAWSIGNRPLDFNCLMSSPRGATGSEIGICLTAKEMADAGHDVHLFTVHFANKPDAWENVKLHHINNIHTEIDSSFDAVISWSEPDLLRYVPASCIRVCYQMLNDWSYCQEGFHDVTDIFITVSNKLQKFITAKMQYPSLEKWNVVPLGCVPELYSDERVPGRIVWTSSADRGLMNLLEIFPKVKKAVPEASLKIFYHFQYGDMLKIDPNSGHVNHPHVVEMAHRLRYCLDAIKRLASLGVEHVGSVSRDRINKELSEASVFAFPCDTVAFTEGFSCSTLEALASFTFPVISDMDCLGEVYNDSGAIVIKSPVRQNLDEFTAQVIKGLTDKNYSNEVISKCREFAKKNTWKNTADKISNIISNHNKFRK